jgi:hypothetical protein
VPGAALGRRGLGVEEEAREPEGHPLVGAQNITGVNPTHGRPFKPVLEGTRVTDEEAEGRREPQYISSMTCFPKPGRSSANEIVRRESGRPRSKPETPVGCQAKSGMRSWLRQRLDEGAHSATA